jgi:hypothetical protein
LEEVHNKLTPLEAVLTELNNGKQEMVDALAMKNVQSSTDKTLSAIADDVRSIAQSPTTIDGGEMYEKQLFGAPTDKTNTYEQPDTPMWNLYQVMANLLSDGRFVTYGGILLAEYGVDSDTIELNMAGAGGAYLTSDGAMYEVDTTHTWDRKKDGKLNRWVAYVFKEEWKDVSLTHSNILSIHIGGKVGIITCTSNTLISEIVVTDGNMLKSFNSNGYSHRLVGNITIKNIDEQSGVLIFAIGNSEKVFVQNLYIKANKIVSPLISATNSNYMPSIYSIRIECEELNSGIYPDIVRYNNALKELYIKARKINTNFINASNTPVLFSPDFIIIEGTEECTITGSNYNDTYNSTTLKYMYIGYDTNDKSKSVTLNSSRLLYLEDIELQDGWCKPFAVLPINNNLPSLTEENMINHILKRLKQDEEMCGSGVTITLGSTNLARLTSEEAVALLDSLTNTYGYTFA